MGTLGRSVRSSRKPTTARIDAGPRTHPAVAKLATVLKEHKEALRHQAATADILRALSRSTTDPQPVFEAIVEHAHRLSGSLYSVLYRYDGKQITLVADRHVSRAASRAHRATYPRLAHRDFLIGRAILDGRTMHSPDLPNDARFSGSRHAFSKHMRRRALIAVPLLHDGVVIGAIATGRAEAKPFSKKEIWLLKTFADQAVIAIEKVRLFNETKASLERQTASAEILKVISGSPTDVQPVFDTIIRNAVRLCEGTGGALFTYDGSMMDVGALDNADADLTASFRRDYPRPVHALVPAGQAILEQTVCNAANVLEGNFAEGLKERARSQGFRSVLAVPMLRGGESIGAIVVSHRRPEPFPDAAVALLKTFADQAVIAIENVRLFNETKESLEQQTAISEVLRVISSSPTDVKPVLDAVAARAARICEASDARIFLTDGDNLRHAAGFGDLPVRTEVFPVNRETASGRAVIDRAAVQIEDIEAESTEQYGLGRELATRAGWRTILSVPLLREQQALGAIGLRRKEARPFSDKQIALLKTFADQAAIAIENVRLFNETKEALERQTATTEVLNVISGSITDARPVFDAISRSVLRLYGARSVTLVVRIGERIDRVGYALADKSADDGSQALWPIPLDEQSLSGRAILRDELVHIKDVDSEPGLAEHSRAITRQTGVRSVLVAPMHSLGSPTGALAVGRRAPGGFSEREVEMIRTFADQAVIAMENVRLFNEIQEKSKQLEVASQHKSQFLASMSHELRTPLNALLGFNEMILGDIYGEVPGDMKPPLVQMQSSGKHLLRLINNVLDLAKIEAGRMELALAEYSVHDTVESVRSTLQPLAAEKGLEFLVAVPADIPLAHGDPGRITQCLMNLAGNSLKFTKAGKVEISVAMNDGRLRYRVADTGIGIPPDKIEGLFTEFKQTDATVASEYGGTGLGLSISKKFVEMHGGRIWAESEPGRGSAFTFEVPLRAKAP